MMREVSRRYWDRICEKAVFSVWNERAVERYQEVRFWRVRWMDKICVAIVVEVSSKEAEQLQMFE